MSKFLKIIRFSVYSRIFNKILKGSIKVFQFPREHVSLSNVWTCLRYLKSNKIHVTNDNTVNDANEQGMVYLWAVSDQIKEKTPAFLFSPRIREIDITDRTN